MSRSSAQWRSSSLVTWVLKGGARAREQGAWVKDEGRADNALRIPEPAQFSIFFLMVDWTGPDNL